MSLDEADWCANVHMIRWHSWSASRLSAGGSVSLPAIVVGSCIFLVFCAETVRSPGLASRSRYFFIGADPTDA